MLATLAILAVIYVIKWQTDPVGCFGNYRWNGALIAR